MKRNIKKKELIVSSSRNGNVTEYIIKRKLNSDNTSEGVHLSDVFRYLPAGLVHKSDTGMGATTLEIKAKRNSIIVEPIKFTASSKAKKSSKRGKSVLYVGSETSIHRKKISNQEILSYVSDSKIKYKKIIVVADSLSRLKNILGDKLFQDYFLLIDEIDSFQLDSTYRSNMERCIDIYKLFPPEKRCLLSATPLEFTDPILSNEPVTRLKYDQPHKRTIKIVFTDSAKHINGLVIGKIESILKEHPKEKIFIAYNSVQKNFSLAQYLVKEGKVAKEEISILCSNSNKANAGNYYKELDSDKLPSLINFVTSAYYTGFDLNEEYHLISVSSIAYSPLSLSADMIKQIGGRCRKKLLSEHIIHDFKDPKDESKKPPSKEEVLAAAQKELDAMNCIKNHLGSNQILKSNSEKLMEMLVVSFNNLNIRFVRKDINNNYVLSYFNIDAFLEKESIFYRFYKSTNLIYTHLKNEGHEMNILLRESKIKVDQEKAEDELTNQRKEDFFKILKRYKDLDTFIRDTKSEQWGTRLNKIANLYFKVKDYLDKETLLRKFQETVDERDSRSFNNLKTAILFQLLPDDHIFKIGARYYFKKGKTYSKDDILAYTKLLITQTNQGSFEPTHVKSIRLLKLMFDCKKMKNTGYKIVGTNPMKIKVIKKPTSLVEDFRLDSLT